MTDGWSWRDDRTAHFALSDDGCPHCGDDFEARLTVDEQVTVLAQWDRYAWNLAHRLRRTYGMHDVDELYAEVRVGFVEAANRFDPSLGLQFSTYATWWGRQAVQRFAEHERRQGFRFAPKGANIRPLSFSAPISGGLRKKEEFVGDTIAQPEPESPPEFPADFWQRVNAELTDRERRVVELRFRQGLTLEESGADLGICKERVRQIQTRAIEKLRRQSGRFAGLLEAA